MAKRLKQFEQVRLGCFTGEVADEQFHGKALDKVRAILYRFQCALDKWVDQKVPAMIAGTET
ncbi:hypothetical protein GCM10025776_28750 [Corallincola platygyrae]